MKRMIDTVSWGPLVPWPGPMALSVTSFVCLWNPDTATINKTVGLCIKRLLAYLIVNVILQLAPSTNKSMAVIIAKW